MASHFYKRLQLKRVYYSGYVPISNDNRLPALGTPVPMIRENRLYQADWLMRFYGFCRTEILSGGEQGMLDPVVDPKLAWALKRRDFFPLDVNRAAREELLRVPGLGVKSVDKLLAARRYKVLRLEDVGRVCRGLERVRPFLVAADWSPGNLTDRLDLGDRFRRVPEQLTLL